MSARLSFIAALVYLVFPVTAVADQHSAITTENCQHTSLPQLLTAAKRQLKAGATKEAQTELLACESNYAASASYSYLLGVASFRVKDLDTAIFSFERALLISPRYLAACYGLAKALYANRELVAAKEHFQRLSDVGDTTYQVKSQHYIGLINHAMGFTKPVYKAHVRVGFGRNYNANSATEDPTFLGIVLSSDSLARAANVAELSISGTVIEPLAPYWSLFANASATRSAFSDNKDLLSDAITATAGVNWLHESSRFQATARSARLRLNNHSFLQQHLFEANWLEQVNTELTWAAGVQLGNLFYQPSSSIRDIRIRGTWSELGWQIPSVDNWHLSAKFSVYDNTAKASNSPYGHMQLSTNVNLAYKEGNHWSATISTNYSDTDYDRPFFGFARNDRIKGISAQFTLNNVGQNNCSLLAHARHRSQTSTVSLYSFSGDEFGVSWGCEFK